MQIKRKKYQVAGNTKLPNLLTLTTPSKISNYNNQYNALNNTTPSPTLPNDNWQYKPEQKAKPVINASSFIPNSTAVQDNTKTIKSDYNAKPNNNIVSYFDYKGDVKSVDIPYQGTAVPSEPKTLYNTYFNTPSNTKGTGIIPFASNMINASNVVGAGMAAKEGIKYGIKKAGQYVDKKMLNYGKDAFTPNLSNVGENLLENKSSLINSQTINLQRNVAPKVKVAKLPFDDVDLGNGLVLRNNPSRTTDQTKILGKNMALKEVLDKETGEYIKLSSWTDENGKLFYKMSANMPSSRLKAGKAYLELEKHIPVGATLMDDTSLSYDSFLNTVKQTKNPKFKTVVHNEFPMNNSSKTVSGLKNEYTGQNLAFATKEEAEQNLTKINELLQKHNLPSAKINYQTQYIDDGDELTYYGITIPQIGLEKLYQLGIPLTALGLSYQNQNNSYKKLGGKIMKKFYKYGGKFQFGSKSLNKTNNDELGFSPSVTPKSSEMITPKSQAAIDNTSTVVRNNTTQTRLSQPSTKVAVANEFIDDMSNLKNDFNYTYGNIEKADTYDKVKVSDEIGKEHNLPKDENGYYRKQYYTQPNKSDESLRSSAGVNSSDYIVDPTVGLVKTKNQDIIEVRPRTYQATVETLTMDNINMPSGQVGMSTYDPESKLPGKMQPGIKLINKDTDIYGDERAYYKDDEKTMYVHDINDVPDELSHDLQFRPESGTDTKKLIKNEEDAVNNYMKEHNINDNIAARDSVAYDKPGTLEYNAHQEIEPVIDKKVSDRSNAILTQQSTNNIYNEYPSLQKISKKDVLYPSLTNNPKSVFKPEVKKIRWSY